MDSEWGTAGCILVFLLISIYMIVWTASASCVKVDNF